MGGAIQTITVILLKISGITVVFMVKDCYICSAKKDKQSFTMGAKIVYKSYNQNDSLLFPPALGDLIPENHPVRTVSAVIDRLDITGIESTYKGGGTSSFHPRMLLKVIVYSYMCNVYSGRRMERLLKENVNYMWLSGMSRPDFRTINRFRSERLSDGRLEEVFRQVVLLLNGEGLVSLRVQYIDGTKIESVANRYTFVWKGSVEKNKSKLEAKVAAVLRTAEEVLAKENAECREEEPCVEDLPERTERILKRMDEQGLSDRKLRRSVEKVRDESLPKLEEYGRHLETLGERNSYSKTDHDATFMRMKEDAMRNGQTKPGYNVQIATENQFITNYGIYWRPTDWGTLIPFLNSFKEKYGKQSEEVVADSGYGNEQNYAYMEGEGMEAYVKYPMFHAEMKRKYVKNAFLPQNMYYNAERDFYVCPMGQHLERCGTRTSVSDLGYRSVLSVYRAVNCTGCPLRGECYKSKSDRRTIEVNHRGNSFKRQARELLTGERGLAHRSTRPVEPEAVFGDIKFNHGFKRFRLKSNRKVKVEFGLVALAHNLRKYSAMLSGRTAAQSPASATA